MLHFRKRSVFLLVTIVTFVPFWRAEAQLKIMPLGDSITQGEISVVVQNQILLSQIDTTKISYRADGAMGILMDSNGGYRLVLEQMLLDMNWDLEMVGQRTQGGGHHEGYPGYMTSDILEILDDILRANPPHVILLHIGTNDLPAPIDADSCYQNINAMLDMIHAFDPEIEVILAQIIPCLQNTSLGEERFPSIIELNNLLPQIPLERDYVTLVDMWTAFVETDDWENALMSGTYHPNEQGYYLMAENWRDKLDIIIKGRSPVVTSISPNEGFNNQANVACVIEGDYFLDGVEIYLHHDGTSEDLFASQVTFENTNRVTAIFDLTQGTIGAWEVIAENPNHMRSIDSPGVIFTIRDASVRAAIFGTVNYGNTNRSVSQSILNLTHDEGTASDTTLNDGNYFFENILYGLTSLVPSKQGDQRDAITGSDALLVLQYLAFLTDLSDDQLIAADVTEDGAISGSDALAILRYLAFYTDNIGATGQWRFDPPDTNFALNENTKVDFESFLLGDANLDWGAVSQKNNIAARERNKPLSSILALMSGEFQICDAGIFEIPVGLVNVSAPVHSLIFTVTYDSTYVQYVTIEKTMSTDNFMLVANGENPGKIHIAMAGINGIETSGEILQLHFKVLAPRCETKSHKLEIARALANDSEIECSVVQETLENVAVMPDQLNLAQNYPNPFNSNTTIRYSIPKPAQVRLSIFNAMGQEIKTFVNAFQQADFYQIDWNSDRLSSGVYFCVLKAGDISQTIKMILIR